MLFARCNDITVRQVKFVKERGQDTQWICGVLVHQYTQQVGHPASPHDCAFLGLLFLAPLFFFAIMIGRHANACPPQNVNERVTIRHDIYVSEFILS